MRLTRLTLRGVTCFTAETPVAVDFDAVGAGLVACIGPNGAGKTTLLEAAVAALHRSFPSRPGWFENFSSRDAFIEASFFDLERADEVTVRTTVDAEKRTTEQYVFVKGKSVTTGRAKEAEAAIEKRFGSLSLLLASVFASQNKSGNFLLLPKRDRKALMVELLGLSYLEALHESAKEHRNFGETELAGARARAESCLTEVAILPDFAEQERGLRLLVGKREQEVREARSAEETAASRLERARVAAGKLTGLRENLSSARRELETAQRELREAETLPARIEAQAQRELDAIAAADPHAMERRARERHAKAVAELDARKAELEATVAREDEVQAAQEELVALEAEAKELEEAHRRASELLGEVKLAEGNLSHAERSFADATRAYETERGRLERQRGLLSEVPCTDAPAWRPADNPHLVARELATACPLLDDARAAGDVLGRMQLPSDEALLVKRQRLADARAAAEKATFTCDPVRLDEIQSRINELRNLLPLRTLVARAKDELEGLKKRYGVAEHVLEDELEQVTSARERAAAGRARVEEDRAAALQEADQKLRVARRRLDEASERETAAVQALAGAEATDAEVAESEYRTAVATTRTAKAKLRKADQELAAVTARLEQLREKKRSLKTLKEAVAIAEEAVGDWGLLAQALGRDGIQALEIDASGPEVARITNELLEACYGPRFSIAFETIGLALAIFKARKSGVRWRTLFRDETAGALDTVNAQAYVDMLRRALGLGGFDQVLFVSHSQLVWERADARIVLDGGRVVANGASLAIPEEVQT